jgi:hypothetical protein
MRMGSRSEQIRQEIEQAFSGVSYPGDDAITRTPGLEGQQLRENFRGRHWKEVPREVLRYHHDNLAFFTEAGLQFFLPAYLFAALDDFWDVLDFVLSHLLPSSRDDLEAFRTHVEERFGQFTPEQRRALRSFLEFVRDEMPDRYMPQPQRVEQALDLYWHAPV